MLRAGVVEGERRRGRSDWYEERIRLSLPSFCMFSEGTALMIIFVRAQPRWAPASSPDTTRAMCHESVGVVKGAPSTTRPCNEPTASPPARPPRPSPPPRTKQRPRHLPAASSTASLAASPPSSPPCLCRLHETQPCVAVQPKEGRKEGVDGRPAGSSGAPRTLVEKENRQQDRGRVLSVFVGDFTPATKLCNRRTFRPAYFADPTDEFS